MKSKNILLLNFGFNVLFYFKFTVHFRVIVFFYCYCLFIVLQYYFYNNRKKCNDRTENVQIWEVETG